MTIIESCIERFENSIFQGFLSIDIANTSNIHHNSYFKGLILFLKIDNVLHAVGGKGSGFLFWGRWIIEQAAIESSVHDQ